MVDLSPFGPMGQRRDTLLDRLQAIVANDDRIVAAWLGGSSGRDTTDVLSDLDVFCVIRDDRFDRWLDERDSLYRGMGTPLLVGPDRKSMVAPGGRSQSVIFAGPVAMDWECHPKRKAVRQPDTRLLLERGAVPIWQPAAISPEQCREEMGRQLSFFWAMTPIAIKAIARQATQRAVTQIDLLSEAFVALWRLVHEPSRAGIGGAHWLHLQRDADLIRRLPDLGSEIGPPTCFRVVKSLTAEVLDLHPVLANAGVVIPTEAVREIMAFAEAVGATLRTTNPGDVS